MLPNFIQVDNSAVAGAGVPTPPKSPSGAENGFYVAIFWHLVGGTMTLHCKGSDGIVHVVNAAGEPVTCDTVVL